MILRKEQTFSKLRKKFAERKICKEFSKIIKDLKIWLTFFVNKHSQNTCQNIIIMISCQVLASHSLNIIILHNIFN